MGGQVNLVMKTPKRGNFEEVILWFERQLPKLGVDIRLKTDATVESVLAEDPDVVLVATGGPGHPWPFRVNRGVLQPAIARPQQAAGESKLPTSVSAAQLLF